MIQNFFGDHLGDGWVNQWGPQERGFYMGLYLAEQSITLGSGFRATDWNDPQAGSKSPIISLMGNFYDAMRELEEKRPLTCIILDMYFFGSFDKTTDIARELNLDCALVYAKYKTGVRILHRRLLGRVQVRPNRESEQDRKLAKELNQPLGRGSCRLRISPKKEGAWFRG